MNPTTASRVHVALGTTNLDAAVRFYTTLFGTEPVKRKHDYAKFDVAEPSVNLSLNAGDGPVKLPRGMHFGVEVGSSRAVLEAQARLEASGLPTQTEEAVTCCYATQDKVWAVDPDGHPWEIFVVHADSDVNTVHEEAAAQCCR